MDTKIDNTTAATFGGVSEPLHQPVFLSGTFIAEILTTELAYNAVIEALNCHATGDYCQPLKPYIRPRGREGEYDGGRYIAMPAYVGGEIQRVGIKWIASMPKNVNRGLPRASGVLVLNDLNTGRPQAIMECGTLSARRSGAVAAIAVNFLGPPGAKCVALLGAGVIGKEAIRALDERCSGIEEFRIHDPRYDQAYALAYWAVHTLHRKVAVCPTPENCIRGANVIIPATTGSKDYIRLEWLTTRPWLVVALSLDDCQAEVPLSANKLVVDDYDQSVREEKLLHRLVREGSCSRDTIYAQLGEIIHGDKARPDNSDCVYLNPMGMGIEDIAVAASVYKAAYDQASGTPTQTAGFPCHCFNKKENSHVGS